MFFLKRYAIRGMFWVRVNILRDYPTSELLHFWKAAYVFANGTPERGECDISVQRDISVQGKHYVFHTRAYKFAGATVPAYDRRYSAPELREMALNLFKRRMLHPDNNPLVVYSADGLDFMLSHLSPDETHFVEQWWERDEE